MIPFLQLDEVRQLGYEMICIDTCMDVLSIVTCMHVCRTFEEYYDRRRTWGCRLNNVLYLLYITLIKYNTVSLSLLPFNFSSIPAAINHSRKHFFKWSMNHWMDMESPSLLIYLCPRWARLLCRDIPTLEWVEYRVINVTRGKLITVILCEHRMLSGGLWWWDISLF